MGIEWLLVQDSSSTKSLCFFLEPSTLYAVYYWFNPGRSVPTGLKYCWLRRTKESNQPKKKKKKRNNNWQMYRVDPAWLIRYTNFLFWLDGFLSMKNVIISTIKILMRFCLSLTWVRNAWTHWPYQALRILMRWFFWVDTLLYKCKDVP